MVDLEQLTCKACGDDWKREVKRGRKPVECPECKGGDELDGIEVLKCQACNIKWQREVKPGRKPVTCLDCDDVPAAPEKKEKKKKKAKPKKKKSQKEKKPEPEKVKEEKKEEVDDSTETLTCETCYNDWIREVKPGRKPTTSPDCEKPSRKRRKKRQKSDQDTLADVIDEIEVNKEGMHEKAIEESSWYPSFVIDEKEVEKGAVLYCFDDKELYTFRGIVIRKNLDENGNQTGYCEVNGATGIYSSKFRAIGLHKLQVP